MDDYWQMKCSSTLQSTTPARASSSQLQPQEYRNQIMDTGHYFYTQVRKEPSSASCGMIQDSLCFRNTNLSSYNPGRAELGSSFLSLLSGSPSLLQCELQNSSVPKKFITSSGVPVSSNSVVVSAARSGVSVAPVPAGLLSECLWNVNSKVGANLHSNVSSRAVGSANCGSISSLQDFLQAENLNLQGSELAKAVFHDIIPCNQKVNDLFPMREGSQTAMSASKVGKLANIESSQKVPCQAKSSISLQSSVHAIGYPCVFCLGASGDLLLSSTGLLGVVCSCHGWHMSISKFCEHSGLFDVNPGNAVRVDSGETIAHWRKMYFFKFGIRVPEDQSGWDWPEGFSATANLVKHGATLPNMSKNLDLSYLSGSSGALVGSRKSPNNIVSMRNPVTGHNFVNEGFHNQKQRNAQEGCNFLDKGLASASQINLHAVGHGQIMECPISEGSMVSKLVEKRTSNNDCQSISSHTDSACRIGNLFISSPNLNRSKTLGMDSNISRFNSSKEGDIRGGDAVPSNIELRLGQPSQQSQTQGNSNLPVFGSHQFYTHGNPQTSVLPEQLIHNSSNSMVMGECKQYLQAAANRCNSSARREHSLLNIGTDASGASSAIDATKMEQFKDDAARGSVISMLLSHLKMPEERLQFNSEHVMPKTNCESHTAKHDQISFPWNRGNGMERKLIVNELNCHKDVDKGKGVGCVTDGWHVGTESAFRLPTKQVEHSTTFSAVVNGTGHHSCSAVARGHDKSSHSHRFSGLTPDASDARKPSSYSGMISCLGRNGHFGHDFLRSISSSMDSGPILLSQTVPVALSATTSFSVPSPTSTLPNKECIGISPYSLDNNVKNFAFRQVLESSDQDHAFTSSGTNHGKGRFLNSFGVKMHGYNVEPSLPKDLSRAPDITSKKDIPELAMNSLQSGVSCWMSGECEKLAPVAGLNRWSNFSPFLQTTSVHPKGLETQFQLSCDHCPNELPSLRYGNSEHIITPSRDHENCCQRVPYTYLPDKCSCAIHVNHLIGICDFEGKTAIDAIEEHAGSSGGMASLLFASKIDDQYSSLKEKVISLDQRAKLDGQVPKKIVSHGFHWRDVPRKITESRNVTCADQPADLFNGKVNIEDQITDPAAKCFKRPTQDAECLKEPEVSNISSGCSAPAITQASIEVNNLDSCTVDAGNTRNGKDLIVDEGSGIDKCWSSDDALDSERSSEFFGCPRKIKSVNEKSSKELPNQLSCSLIDELRFRDSFRSKNVRYQIHSGTTEHERINRTQKSGRSFKTGKRKRATKWKMLDASFLASGTHNDSPKCISSAEWHSCSYNDVQKLLQPDERVSQNYACSTGQSFKRRRSSLSSSKNVSRKRDLHRLYNKEEEKSDYRVQFRVNDDSIEIFEASGRKKFRSGLTSLTNKQFRMQEPDCADVLNCNSVDRVIFSSNQPVSVCKSKERPIVCGKYGAISNGDLSKPAKIVPLRKILKIARICAVTENDGLRLTSVKELKKTCSKGNKRCFTKFSSVWKEREIEAHDATVCTEMDPDNFMEETETACFSGGKECNDVSYTLEKESHDDSEKNHSIRKARTVMRLKTKYKEVRKRSLHELTIEGKGSTCANLSATKMPNSAPQTKCRYLGKFLKNSESAKCHVGELYNARKSTEEHQCQSSVSNLDAFCCVCGSSNKDEINCLLECNRCLIRVHRACYGVSKVPKSHWYCRPCRASSKNIVCVLCGYGGGAMTRAIRSRNIVKSLLKAWNVVMDTRYENSISPSEAFLEDQFAMSTSRSVLQSDTFPVIRPVDNSITAGVLYSTAKQWVHMVCGLWTPGTRCPNVDTMSAFDVSGASRPKVNVVCSMCNRPGGSCIQCRVLGCSIQFHPWCAHQKGLLQSEVEGIDNENVGFYGRCLIHAAYHQCDSDGDPVDNEISCPGERGGCARTEGFKGRKQEGFQCRLSCQSNGNGGCLVPQEQLNAWLHINGQKSCTKGLPKLPISDIEHDCRKEYNRYKQSKGWKHLVVYKSGIHALGLYTSQFISRGAMVVEYVGEIVGLRVADKRENEYQSGRKVQYKSACYFFRIDKEHIIDATRKGGIARFVNHSCLPNCVAKVISVRTEKKVVFFAERDIYPGEEITYDYHFNHEDEGKKIPCFCNSKNCRRYLN